MDRSVLKKLKEIVAGQISTAAEDLACYSYDAGGLSRMPEAVVFPAEVDQVSRIMQLASEKGIPVVPRGAGTGMTGGALAPPGGVVMVMNRFSRILEIDRENQVAVVEPGVVTGDFQKEVARLGLFYPPDPASLGFCTLGGNVANCSGGPSAVKYGVTRDYVLGLEVVMPDGTILNTGVRTAKGVMGYDLTRLFVGSEGTLGIITKIIVRLLILPEARTTFQIVTQDMGRAAGLVARLLGHGLLPCTLEYMDRTALQVVASFLPGSLPDDAGAMLLVEFDGDAESVGLQERRFNEFIKSQPDYDQFLTVRQAEGADEVEELWRARRSISPASFQIRPDKISEDVVVPRTRIPELVRFTEKMAAELDIVILTFGHAGDGNIHVNIMVDKSDPGENENGVIATLRLFEYVLSLSGTLSGEHGVGLAKAEFLSLELDDAVIRVMRKIKEIFDPHNILNPGKIFAA